MAQGLAAIAEQKRKQAEAQAAASGSTPPTTPTKKGAIHPSIAGLKAAKPTPAAKYEPIKEKSEAEKEESRRMAEAEMRVRAAKRGQ